MVTFLPQKSIMNANVHSGDIISSSQIRHHSNKFCRVISLFWTLFSFCFWLFKTNSEAYLCTNLINGKTESCATNKERTRMEVHPHIFIHFIFCIHTFSSLIIYDWIYKISPETMMRAELSFKVNNLHRNHYINKSGLLNISNSRTSRVLKKVILIQHLLKINLDTWEKNLRNTWTIICLNYL